MSNNNKLSDLRIYLVLMIPDNKAKEPLDRVTCMRKKYPWNEYTVMFDKRYQVNRTDIFLTLSRVKERL
jgi:hypothetical protein